MAKIGRPRKFENHEQFATAVQHYFDSIRITRPAFEKYIDGIDANGKPICKEQPVITNAGTQFMSVTWLQHPSIEGMCCHLGISRETLRRYSKDEEFRDTYTRARQIIEEYIETKLLYDSKTVRAAMFVLKCCFGWREVKRQERIEPNRPASVSLLTNKEREAEIKRLKNELGYIHSQP
ncbi:MAG TPA: terminase small subunit [Candidatus Aquicultor sp.]|jgi:hypothetical protein